ncbi:MAG: hypothetical protein IJV71_01795, partial [Lachnospiraceae bacterium]|nr:hypothetical protein [Lachnospiraceae bacterium]
RFADVNGELVPSSYEIKDGDTIIIRDFYSVEQILTFMDVDGATKRVMVNGHEASMDEPVYAGFKVVTEDKPVNAQESDSADEQELDVDNDDVEADAATDVSTGDESGRNEDSNESKPESKAEKTDVTDAQPTDIYIIVNNKTVCLKGKKKYIFVDILDFYPFDTKVAGGTELITKLNGEKCDFMAPLYEGCVVEIYWN